MIGAIRSEHPRDLLPHDPQSPRLMNCRKHRLFSSPANNCQLPTTFPQTGSNKCCLMKTGENRLNYKADVRLLNA